MKRVIALLFLVALPVMIFAQTNGKIAGVVSNTAGTPLAGANVVVLGTSYGAAADADGRYFILDVPAGKYTVQFQYIGYATTEVTNIDVFSGLTTDLSQSLTEETIAGEVVNVVAERPLIQVDKTSSINILTAEDLENLPIRNLNELIETMPGVIVQDGGIHIRGGRDNEVAFFVNGAPTTGMSGRGNLIYIPQEATEEIQVQVGGYDASVGGANSGVITRQIRRGTSTWQGDLTLQNNGAGLGNDFLGTKSFGHSLMVGNISGPLFGDKIKFFTGFEINNQNDRYTTVGESFEFLNRADQSPQNAAYIDSVDLAWPGYRKAPFKYSTIASTLTFDFAPIINNLSVVYTAEENWFSGDIQDYMQDHGATVRPAVDDPADAYSVDIKGRGNYWDLTRLLITDELSYNLSANTLIKLNLGYLSVIRDDKDEWFGNDWKKWRDGDAVQAELGVADTVWTPFKDRYSEKNDYRVNGVLFSRPGTAPDFFYTHTETKQYSAGGSFTSVLDRHTVSAGFNWRQYNSRRLDIQANGIIYAADPTYGLETYGITTYGSWEAVPIEFKRVYIDGYGYDLEENKIEDRKVYGSGEDITYMDGAKKPSEFGFYLQDKFEFDDIIVNAGIRIDVLDPDEETLLYPDSVEVYDESSYINLNEWKKVDPFTYIQPRIGISFPVSDVAKIYGYYGKFAQLPDLASNWFTAYDYRTQIARGGNFYTNPVGFGIEPIETTQYEIGFAQSFGNYMALDITGFYKNQKGLVTTERVDNPAGDLSSAYNRRVNGDFATTKGLELKFTLRRTNRLAGEVNYTFSQAEGTGSNSTSYISAVDRGSDTPKMIMPVDFNQPHVGSIKLDYRFGDNDGGVLLENFGANLLLNFSSGHAYTFVYRPAGGQIDAYDAGVDYMLDTRSRQALEPIGSSMTPWIFDADLRLDKRIKLGIADLTVFMRITNLFDARNVINVYQATGSGEDDGFITNEVYSSDFVTLFGGDVDGNGIDDYVELYDAMNIQNDESYRTQVGGRLISAPRQIFVGLTVNF